MTTVGILAILFVLFVLWLVYGLAHVLGDEP